MKIINLGWPIDSYWQPVRSAILAAAGLLVALLLSTFDIHSYTLSDTAVLPGGVKTHQKFFYHNWKKGYPILIIFGTHIFNTAGHQMPVQFLTSPNVCLCTTWEKQQTKYALKYKKNFNKFYLSRSVATNSQSIPRFDCCVTACLLNRHNIQEYWWIQEATGEVWIGLEQNVIDAATNERRKCLGVESMFVCQHF